MELINYLLAGLISFFGLIFGMILVSIAPEEQKPGRKYFILLQNLFFILSAVFFLIFLELNAIFIFLAVVLLIVYFLKVKVENVKRSQSMYLILAVIFFLSLRSSNLFLIEAVLIFLFGMPTGSLLFNRKKKNYFKVVFKNIIFLVVVWGLFLFNNYYQYLFA